MKILLDWEIKELDRMEKGSLSRAKFEVNTDNKEVEFLEGNLLSFEDIEKLFSKLCDLDVYGSKTKLEKFEKQQKLKEGREWNKFLKRNDLAKKWKEFKEE